MHSFNLLSFSTATLPGMARKDMYVGIGPFTLAFSLGMALAIALVVLCLTGMSLPCYDLVGLYV